MNSNEIPAVSCSIAPWLSIQNGKRAVEFYKAAFGAVEKHHVENEAGAVVSRLSVNGADFWLSGESPDAQGNYNPEPQSSGATRMILTVPDPDAIFAKAIAAGAKQVYGMSEGHGWRIGRVIDPFGHHWEIGRPLPGACGQ